MDHVTYQDPGHVDAAASDAALSRLQSVARGFAHEAAGAAGRRAVGYHDIAAATERLCAAIDRAERAGAAPSAIRAAVAPAREAAATSPFVRRLQTWPRGYAGDFETIAQLIEQRIDADPDTAAAHIERHALSTPIAQQHRNKIAHQAQLILETVAAAQRAGRAARILLIACGGAQDVQRALPLLQAVPCRIVLNDIDAGALQLARHHVSALADKVRFVEGNALAVLPALGRDGPFDLILAGGLFDYLSDRQIAFLLRNAERRLLAPHGRFVFTNIATGNPYRGWLEYVADWKLVERSGSDITGIVADAGLDTAQLRLTDDATGLTLIAEWRKTERADSAVPHVSGPLAPAWMVANVRSCHVAASGVPG